MIIRIIAALSVGLVTTSLPVLASSKPFEYYTKCALINNGVHEDTCKVIETRESSGRLKTRNIFSNKLSFSIKSWLNSEDEYVTWDSYNKRDYYWTYRESYINGARFTAVTEWFFLEQVSWY